MLQYGVLLAVKIETFWLTNTSTQHAALTTQTIRGLLKQDQFKLCFQKRESRMYAEWRVYGIFVFVFISVSKH